MTDLQKLVDKILHDVGSVLLGKQQQIKLALTCLFANGHLLIEDLPGMGKTTLAHALANVLGLSFNRIQFTSDLLPADVLGVSVFDKHTSAFVFHGGPVFTQLLLADEINRTTPKTQSALLEAMEERQVTLEGETRQLPEPFFVIATQNPASQSGTFALPESQLDRFLMKIELGYPDPESERALFLGKDCRRASAQLSPCLSLPQLQKIQTHVSQVKVSASLLDYLQRLVAASRESEDVTCGLSPRGALALLTAAKAWAMIEGRQYVIPEDLQAVMPAVAGHRLRSATDPQAGVLLVESILNRTDVIGE